MSSTKAQKQSPAKPAAKGKAKANAKVNESKVKEGKSASAPKAAGAPLAEAPVEVDKRFTQFATTTAALRVDSSTRAVLDAPLLTSEQLASILDRADVETDRDFTSMKKFEASLRQVDGKSGAAAAGRSQFHAVVHHMAVNLGKILREDAARAREQRKNEAAAAAPPAADASMPPPPPPPMMRVRGGNSQFGDDGSGSDFDSDDGDLPPLEHIDLDSDASIDGDVDVDDKSEEVLDEIYDVD